MPSPDTAGLVALGRILRHLASGGEGTVAGLAGQLGVPRSSAFALVRMLEGSGIVKRDAGGVALGPAAAALGFAAHGLAGLDGAADALVGALRDATGGTASLVVRAGREPGAADGAGDTAGDTDDVALVTRPGRPGTQAAPRGRLIRLEAVVAEETGASRTVLRLELDSSLSEPDMLGARACLDRTAAVLRSSLQPGARTAQMSTDLFRVRDHVPSFEASVAEYRALSSATRAHLPGRLDIAYGAHPDERLDLFFPPDGGPNLPIHLFVHGGYWRAFSKNDYSFVADSVTACGAIAAIMDYSLMPAARMATLVAQVRRAAHWLRANAETFGGAPDALSASGHSAGGHLIGYLALAGCDDAAPPQLIVPSLLAISGLYDLEPLSRSFLQAEVGFQAHEIAAWSPLSARPIPDVRWDILVGARETAPFHRQADAMAGHLRSAGLAPRHTAVPDEDHMSIVRSLGRVGTPVAGRLADCIAATPT